jgi:hypothetical protein
MNFSFSKKKTNFPLFVWIFRFQKSNFSACMNFSFAKFLQLKNFFISFEKILQPRILIFLVSKNFHS